MRGLCLMYDEPKSPNEAVAVAAITAAVLLLALSLGCCWFVAAGPRAVARGLRAAEAAVD